MNPAPIDAEAPACPVHPYGYHAHGRVAAGDDGRVFRDHSVMGVPARCARLEQELEDADRELDFIDRLWVLERAPRSRFASTLVLVASAAATVVAAGEWAAGAVAGVAVGGVVLALACDRAEVRVHRARLDRVRDWHKRVGTPR